MKAEDKFNEIKQRYIDAYERYNNKKLYKIQFEKGWVYLDSNKTFRPSKFRVSQLEKMTETLERRLTRKIKL